MQLKSSPTVAVEKKDLSCLASIFSRSHTQKRHSFKSKCLINRRFKRDVEAMGFLLKKPPSETIELEKHRRPPDSQHVLKKRGEKQRQRKFGMHRTPQICLPSVMEHKICPKNKLTIGAREQPRCKEYPETRQKYKNQQMRNYGNQFEMHFSIIFRGHKKSYFFSRNRLGLGIRERRDFLFKIFSLVIFFF